jgi:hypothetical protein
VRQGGSYVNIPGCMYRDPSRADFDRNLSAIVHSAFRVADAEGARIKSEFISRGMGQSTPLISTIAGRHDEIHADATTKAMHLIRDFVGRVHASASEVAAWGRLQLDNMSATLVATIPSAGFPQVLQQIQRQCRAVFDQRIESALKDIEAGFIGGRNIVERDADRRAIILQRLYDQRHHSDGFIPVPENGGSPEERITAVNIARQLSQNGLIDWKELSGAGMGMARITAQGVDIVEGTRASPITIAINRSINIHGSTNVQVGEGNRQEISIAGEKVIAAINNSTATAEEKEKAKSVLQSVLSSPVLSAALGLAKGLF